MSIDFYIFGGHTLQENGNRSIRN